MATEKIINGGATTLNGAINNSTTSIVVVNGAVFPSSGDFHITIENEILLCTARSSNTLTVTRGQEGTSAVSHDDGKHVKLDLTKQSLDNYCLKDNILTGVHSSRPSAERAGRMYFPTVGYAWQRDNGASWDQFGPVYKLPGAMPSSGWSWVNQGSATVTTRGGSIILRAPSSASPSLRIRTRTAPSRPFNITIAMRMLGKTSEYFHAGIGWRESSSGKLITYGPTQNPYSSGIQIVEYIKWNSPTSFNALYGTSNWPAGFNVSNNRGLFFLKLITPTNSGQLKNAQWSEDNRRFRTGTANSTLDDFFGSGVTPDEVFIFVSNQNSAEAVAEFMYWEVT